MPTVSWFNNPQEEELPALRFSSISSCRDEVAVGRLLLLHEDRYAATKKATDKATPIQQAKPSHKGVLIMVLTTITNMPAKAPHEAAMQVVCRSTKTP
jgi:hypothetical protein